MRLQDLPKISTSMKKAFKASLKSNYHEFMIGAIIVRNGKVISQGWSQTKTHPYSKKHGQYMTRQGLHIVKNFHAEVASLLKVKNKESLIGATIYVYRQHKNGGLAMSRPCPMCYKMLQEYGFKKMVYTVDGGIAEEYIESRD